MTFATSALYVTKIPWTGVHLHSGPITSPILHWGPKTQMLYPNQTKMNIANNPSIKVGEHGQYLNNILFIYVILHLNFLLVCDLMTDQS